MVEYYNIAYGSKQKPELIKPKGDFGQPICQHNAPVHLLETTLGYSEIIIATLAFCLFVQWQFSIIPIKYVDFRQPND